MKRILVIAPHPDDETLGCGGTLLRHRAEGAECHWVIVTDMPTDDSFTAAQRESRSRLIDHIAEQYGFASLHRFGFSSTTLNPESLRRLIPAISTVIGTIRPDTLYIPFAGDAHSDHRTVFSAAAAASKWFRAPSVRRILAYEVLSETEASIDPTTQGFRPNVFVDVSSTIQDKIRIMSMYSDEMGEFPFPRSERAILALASLRGSTAGLTAAEAFILLKEIA